MHPLRHPRNALVIGVIFVATAIVYWLSPYLGHGHIDYAGITMLAALGIAMGLLFYVLIAGSTND
jgi:apolipoprotein N-acyltransferase